MVTGIEAGLLDVNEDERGLQLIIQRVDGIDQVLGGLFHEPNERAFARREPLGEVWVTKTFSDSRKEITNGCYCGQVRLDV